MTRVGDGDQVSAHSRAVQDVGDGQGLDLFEAVGQHDGDGGVGGKILGSGHDSSFLIDRGGRYPQVSAAAPTP